MLPVLRDDPASSAELQPGVHSRIGLVALPQDRVAFDAGSLGAVILPVARSRVLRLLPLADRTVALLGFAADPPAGGSLDMTAMVGWDGRMLRILALEPLTWQADTGAWLATRIAATGDRTRLWLARDAAVPRSATLWQRARWTDYLAWRRDAPLADAPPRPPVTGTWQQRLAAGRAIVAAALVRPCQDATALLPLCRPPDLAPEIPARR